MDKLLVVSATAGYAVTPPSGAVVRMAVDGGAGAYSAEFEGGTSFVDVSFQCDGAKWQYLNAFFRDRSGFGAEPFLVDLLLDGAPIAEYTAWFVPETFRLAGVNGLVRTAVAQLEVLPAEVDEDSDSSIVEIWQASGGDAEGYVNGFYPILANLPGPG